MRNFLLESLKELTMFDIFDRFSRKLLGRISQHRYAGRIDLHLMKMSKWLYSPMFKVGKDIFLVIDTESV